MKLFRKKTVCLLVAFTFLFALLPIGLWTQPSLAAPSQSQGSATWSDNFSDATGLSQMTGVELSSGKVTLADGEWKQDDWSGDYGQKAWSDTTEGRKKYWKQNGYGTTGELPEAFRYTQYPGGKLTLKPSATANQWIPVGLSGQAEAPPLRDAVTIGSKVYLMGPCPMSAINDIDGIDSDHVWATGGGTGSSMPFVMYWNGTTWTITWLSQIFDPGDWPSTNCNVEGIYAASPDDVWIVGQKGRGGITAGEGQVLHWNGSEWSVDTSFPGGENTELQDISGR